VMNVQRSVQRSATMLGAGGSRCRQLIKIGLSATGMIEVKSPRLNGRGL
jgi:hypothetical protein